MTVVGGAVAARWLRVLFWTARRAPWLVRLLRPLAARLTYRCSPAVARATHANAAFILGPSLTPAGRRRYAHRVISNCIDSVVEFGQNQARSPAQLASRVTQITGEDRYDQARAHRRGAVLVTAHLGSFETAMAALRKREPDVHVVFKRDSFSDFEQLRAAQRAKLGVIEAPVDDGVPGWLRLRDALRNNAVVLFQADRVMPGQSGCEVPFLHGKLEMPTGPFKLARLTGSPVIPVFSLPAPEHRFQLALGEPLWAEDFAHPARGEPDPMLLHVATQIASVIERFPYHWLCLHPVAGTSSQGRMDRKP